MSDGAGSLGRCSPNASLVVSLVLLALAAVLLLRRPSAHARSAVLASWTMTPGVVDPRVTPANVHTTICVSGWSSSVQPAERLHLAAQGRAAARVRPPREPLRLPGGPPDQPRDRRQPHRPAQPLARALPARVGGRPDRERAPPQGLRRLARPSRSATRGVAAQAHPGVSAHAPAACGCATTHDRWRSPSSSSTRSIVRFAGDSGDGMQLTGDRFTSETAALGNDLSTLPDYPAEIRAPAGSLPGRLGVPDPLLGSRHPDARRPPRRARRDEPGGAARRTSATSRRARR